MKRFSIKYMIIAFILLLAVSCNKDFLSEKPLDEFSQEDLWNDPSLVDLFINSIYQGLDIPYAKFMQLVFVDEGHRRDDQSVLDFNNCLITPDQIRGWNSGNGHPNFLWGPIYKNVRNCNLFFDNIDNVPFDSTLIDGKTLKDRMVGEVHFLRAYLYFQLTSLYGGVPLIQSSYGLDDDFEIERDSYEACIDFIVEECDQAAALLPLIESGDNNGRVTKGAALALKSRVLLYAASDLHNTTVFPGYAHPELLGYIGGSRVDRWKAAKDAAKAVINLNLYSLYKGNPAPTDSIAQNISDLFLSYGNEEDIWRKFFTNNTTAYENNILNNNGSNGYHGGGNNAPLGDIVDDYEMADGTPFSWNNPTEAAAPYKNRDPRFYASILYEGAKWRARTADAIQIDPLGIIQVGTWEKWNNSSNSKIETHGLDSRNSVLSAFEGSYTGYYLRKFLDPTKEERFQDLAQDIPWRYFRYAEILLNYAEACIELGEDAEARNYINMIRKRAGMPDINEAGDALRQRYRHERRIEFAFEDQRFWDVRRWLIGPEAYRPVHKVNVVYKLNANHTTATIPTITSEEFESRSWNDKAYFFPISRDEINKNNLLMQNPGYE